MAAAGANEAAGAAGALGAAGAPGAAPVALPLFPRYSENPFLMLPPDGIPEAAAIQRGTYLFDQIRGWLDGTYRSQFAAFNPPQGWAMPADHIDLIVSYFDSPERKEWLGRQFYAMQGGQAIPLGPSPIDNDDIPMFFNWLFNIPSQQIPHNQPSPLTFLNNELQVQEGGRRRRKRSRRSTRRASARRRRRSQRK